MTDSITVSGYRSYLVRFWQSTAQGGWHASAQCVQTGNTVLFGNVDSLFAFLQTEIKGRPRSGAAHITPLQANQA